MNEQLPDGLQLAIQYCNIGTTHDRRNFAEDAIRAEHAQRLTLQHHAADQVWRIADLEVKCVTLKELHDAATDERNTARGAVRELERQVFALQQQRDVLQTCLDRHQRDEADPPGYLQDAVIRAAGLGALHTERDAAIKERDELRAKYDELLVALHGIGAALGIPEGDRSPYSVTCGVLERVNRLAEIEAQEPVAWVLHSTSRRPRPYVVGHRKHLPGSGSDLVDMGLDHLDPLYARPVPAQAAPDADGARFRWLCEDHSDRETRERCRSLIDRLPVMSYSDAVMSIDAAMAAAPEHKA